MGLPSSATTIEKCRGSCIRPQTQWPWRFGCCAWCISWGLPTCICTGTIRARSRSTLPGLCTLSCCWWTRPPWWSCRHAQLSCDCFFLHAAWLHWRVSYSRSRILVLHHTSCYQRACLHSLPPSRPGADTQNLVGSTKLPPAYNFLLPHCVLRGWKLKACWFQRLPGKVDEHHLYLPVWR